MKVMVGKGTGFVAQRGAGSLLAGGYEVVESSRNPQDYGLTRNAVGPADAVVNLVETSIGGGRGTKRQQARIRHPRVKRTEQLVAPIDTVVDEDGVPGDSILARVCAESEAAAARAPVRRITVLFPIALLAIVGVVPAFALAAVRSTQPLTQRLLAANEIPGYTIVRPTVKLLGLDDLAAVTGRSPKQLARAGFLAAAVENLRGPSPIPDKRFISQSWVIRFRSASQARAFLTLLIRERHSIPSGVRRREFTAPGIPGARGTRLTQSRPQQRLDEYDVVFVAGPFTYEANVFTPNGVPSQASFVAAVGDYYHRLARS